MVSTPDYVFLPVDHISDVFCPKKFKSIYFLEKSVLLL